MHHGRSHRSFALDILGYLFFYFLPVFISNCAFENFGKPLHSAACTTDRVASPNVKLSSLGQSVRSSSSWEEEDGWIIDGTLHACGYIREQGAAAAAGSQGPLDATASRMRPIGRLDM